MIIVRGIPLYWGVEPDAADRTFFTRATMEEALPPYRYSTRAFRIRVSHRHWLHIGLCRYKDTVTPWGLEVLPERIGEWGRGLPESEDTSEASEPVRPDGSGPGPVDDGDVDAADGGTAEGSDAQRDRPGVAPVGTGPPLGADAPGSALTEGSV